MHLEIWNAEEGKNERRLENAHVAEKDLTGVHLAILVAGTHEDLWDNLVPSRLEEHALALLVAEDWHRDVLQDGRKNPTLAQSAPPGNGDEDKNECDKKRELEVDPPCDCPKLPDQLVVVARQADGDDVVGKGDPPLGADQGQVVLVCEEVVFWMDNFFRRLQLQVMVGLAEMMMQLL